MASEGPAGPCTRVHPFAAAARKKTAAKGASKDDAEDEGDSLKKVSLMEDARRSANVDLPWSMWATMQKLRISDASYAFTTPVATFGVPAVSSRLVLELSV